MPRASPNFRLYLLGSFRLERDSRAIKLSTRKVESLLAYLALFPEAHSREKLAAQFWGDVSDTLARGSLRKALTLLRRQLGTNLLLADREAIQLNPEFPLWVDSKEIERLRDLQLGNQSLKFFISQYADLLPDFYDDWVANERERLRTLYVNALLRLTQDYRSSSEYGAAIELAGKILAVDRANERAHQHLMFCYLASGNRDAALKQYEHCQRTLHEVLAVEPSADTTALYQWIRQASAETRMFESRITNLPIPLSSFVGRKSEMAQVKQLLTSARLVTLTGAGGSGKTRLAIQTATDLIDSFKDGVWWVELAALADEKLVPAQTAKAFGIQENPNEPIIETQVNWLQPRHLLVILDNCEHLIGACAQLAARLLGACPNLKILATSREALGITGEFAWRVASLSVPDSPALSELLLSFDSIRLFVERASAHKPGFTLTEQNAAPIAQICHRLGGIPLAIELAAARVKTLSVQQIAERLDDRFHLLTQGSRTALPRQQTLRATIDWSYDLLSESEKILFQRLSVFAGGWTLDAAEPVCASEGLGQSQVYETLARLVDKSLVNVSEQDGAPRYTLLETIRQYAREKLDAAGKAAPVRNRHLEFFAQFMEEVDPKLRGPNQVFLFDRVELEHDNIRAALVWALEGGNVDTGLRLAGAWHWFCGTRGFIVEGRGWCGRLLARGENASKPARAIALRGYGILTWMLGDNPGAIKAFEKSLELYRELEDKRNIGWLLGFLALPVSSVGNWEKAKLLYAESLKLRREIGDKWGEALVLRDLASHAKLEGDSALAKAMYAEALGLFREVGDWRHIARTLGNQAEAARLQGDLTGSQALLREATTSLFRIRDKFALSFILLQGWAPLAALQGKVSRAVRIFGSGDAIRKIIGTPLSPSAQGEIDTQLTTLHAQLGDDAFDAAWNKGYAMSFEQAIEYALAEDKPGN